MKMTNIFNNRQVQDLAWVIASPPLLSGSYNNVYWWDDAHCKKEFNDCLPTLLALDKQPEPLLSHLAQLNSGRLGLRFESFIAYWIKISPNYQLIKQNIQIIESGHTYGELDFIIKDIHTNNIIHLEVAVKFYLGMMLGTQPSVDPYHWFGTNTNDQLGKKVDHLKQHQTQLSEKYQDHLQKSIGIQIDEKHCLLKGRLFYPMGSDIPPQGVNQSHLRGRWLQADNHQFSNKRFVPIEKDYWLAELRQKELRNLTQQQGLHELKRAQCYVELESDSLRINSERNRIFNLPFDFWEFLS